MEILNQKLVPNINSKVCPGMMLSWKLNKITRSPVNTRIFINRNYICAEALAFLSDYDILRQSQNTLVPNTCKCYEKKIFSG